MLNREILRSKWKELKLSMYLLNRNMLTRISIILLILLIVSAFLAPVISPHPQDAQNATNPEIPSRDRARSICLVRTNWGETF